jgi:hypothetical protein
MPILNNEELDDPILFEVCQSFASGQNSFTRASLLPDGQASRLENVTISINGIVKKRLGMVPVFSGYVSTSGSPIQAILWYESVATDRLVAFANGKAHWFDGVNWTQYFNADIPNINEMVSAVQLTDKIYWTDSSKNAVRMYDGSVSTIAGSPQAQGLEVHTNRLIGYDLEDIPDGVAFSDILDGGTWDLVNKLIRLGGGDGGRIVAVKSWQDSMLVVLRQPGYGVWVVQADPLTPVASMYIQCVHQTVGCVSRRTVCQVGQDIWFVSRNGVMSTQKQIATSNNEISIPVSQPVQDVINKIRWEFAYKSSAICYNNYYLLSIPVNDNDPDTVLVHHYLTGGWAVFTNCDAALFYEQPHMGTTRLLVGCHDGHMREWREWQLESQIEVSEDFHDGFNGITLPFTLPAAFPPGDDTVSVVTTRGMVFGDHICPKQPFYGEIELMQSDGTVEVACMRDGAAPEVVAEYTFTPSATTLPATLPFSLGLAAAWETKKFRLAKLSNGKPLAPFKELQYQVTSDSGNFQMRRLMASAFLDTIQLT